MYAFTDDSSCAYGIVAYFRFILEHKVKCMFIASKSRLVPLSQEPSIPRLELQAALIATRLSKWNSYWKEKHIFMDRFENKVKLSQQWWYQFWSIYSSSNKWN